MTDSTQQNITTTSPRQAAMDNGSEWRQDRQLAMFADVTNCVVNALGVCCIVVNISFLIVMRFSKECAAPFHKFIKNLSLSDILASFTFLLTQNWPQGPFSFINPSDDFWSKDLLPYIFRSTPWMFFTSYFLTITCLSVNQYIAVCKPWKYSKLAASNVIMAALCCVWVFSTLQVLVPSLVLLILGLAVDKSVAVEKLYLISTIEMEIWMVIFLVTTFISIILNSLIYQKIRQLKWKRRLSMTSQESANIRMKQEAFLTISLLLVSAVLLRMPFPIVSIITLEMETNSLDVKASIIINSLLLLLLFINFFTDTIIYTIRVKEARRMYKHCFSKLLCCVPTWSFQPIRNSSCRSGANLTKNTERIELSSCRSNSFADVNSGVCLKKNDTDSNDRDNNIVAL